MNKTTLLLLTLLLSYATFAQTSGLNYKALIVDNGTALNTQSVTLKFTILENGTAAIYQETQTATTDANGIVSVNIGEGTALSGTFSSINWGSNPQFLKVEIDTGSGFVDFGTSEFKTVPYAKYADKAGNAFSGNFADLNGVPTGLADGDDVNDADHSTTNELQTLTFDNATRNLTILNGNTVTIPAGSTTGGDGWGTQVAATNSSINGDGTSANPLGVNTSDAVFSGWDKNASDDFSGSFNDLTNVPTGLADGDDDTQLTDAQIATMGYIKNANDADHDATNELQTLNLSGNQLSILNRNTVTFTGWDTDASDDFSGNYDDLSHTPFGLIGSPSTPPSGLSDNMFHLGTVFIGTAYGNTSYKLSVSNNTSENTWQKGIDITVLGGGTGDRTGIVTTVSGTSTGNIYGLNTSIINSQDGSQTVIRNSLSNDGNGDHTGTSNSIGGAGTGQHYGTKNLMYANGTGNNMGVYSELNGTGNGRQFGTKNNITNDGTGLHFGTYNLINNDGTGKHYGNYNLISGDGTGEQYGVVNEIINTGDGSHYGINNILSGTGSGHRTGVSNQIEGGGSASHTGIYNGLQGSSSGSHFGIINSLSGDGAGEQYGVKNSISNTGNTNHYGSYNVLNGSGSGIHYGVSSYLFGNGTGIQYGVRTSIENTGNAKHYGNHNMLSGNGSGNKYGTYNEIRTTAGGTHYAVYADAQKTGSYAGYFLGKVSIKDGTEGVGKIFTSDADGIGSWQDVSAWDTDASDDVQSLNDLSDAKTDDSSIYIGQDSGLNDINNDNGNVGIGYSSLKQNTTGYGNIAIGKYTLSNNNANSYSTAIGYRAMIYANSSATGLPTYNVAIGSYALNGSGIPANNTGNNNTALGSNALYNNSTGSFNSANGTGALNYNTTGNKNTASGYKAGFLNTTGSGNLFLGYQAGYNETGSDKLYIDNSDTTTPLIYGDFNTNELTVNGALKTTRGVTNNLGGTDGLVKTGTKTMISNSGNAIHYGSLTYLQGTGNGKQYGSKISITNSGDGNQYAFHNSISGSGTGNKYGLYSIIYSSTGGTHYGVYSQAEKSGSYAGYFVGSMAIKKNSLFDDGHLTLTETDDANDGARMMFANAIETDNVWTLWGKADDTSDDGRFNFHYTGTGNIMTIRGNGKVGINRDPVTNALEVNGTASKSTAGSWLGNSDKRLKTNINTIDPENALRKIRMLRGVTYEWNDNKTGNTRPTGVQYGFIAQEIMEVFPSKVSKDNLGYYQTAYGDYDPLFVQAIKALDKKVEEVEKLKNEVNELKKRLDKLEKMILNNK